MDNGELKIEAYVILYLRYSIRDSLGAL